MAQDARGVIYQIDEQPGLIEAQGTVFPNPFYSEANSRQAHDNLSDIDANISFLQRMVVDQTGDSIQPILDEIAKLEKDPFVTDLSFFDPATGKNLLDLVGLAVGETDFLNHATVSAESSYDYEVSLLNGNLNFVATPGVSPQIEVGSGGLATLVGGTKGTLFLWQPKDVLWEHNGQGNSLFLEPEFGAVPHASGRLTLNLLTGEGTNPYGGTLQISNADTVVGGFDAGEHRCQ